VSERDDLGAKPGRQPAEGVRIIKAEEAQAALEAGEAAGRRPDDQLRFGDVPPAPAGPRPAHRFPLPDSVDPAEAVELPPLASRRDNPQPTPRDLRGRPGRAVSGSGAEPRTEEPQAGDVPPWASPPSPPAPPAPPTVVMPSGPRPDADAGGWTRPAPAPEGGRSGTAAGLDDVWTEAGTDRTTEMGVAPAGTTDVPEEGINLIGSQPEMPHWSEPPTGEVPRLRLDAEEPSEDDLEAWRALGSRGVRWRDEDDWDDVGELSDLADDEEPTGALDMTRTEHSDLYSFDEDFDRVTGGRTGSNPVVDLTDPPLDDEDDAVPPRRSGGRGRSRSGRGAGLVGRGSGRGARSPVAGSGSAAPAAAGAASGATAEGRGLRRGGRPPVVAGMTGPDEPVTTAAAASGPGTATGRPAHRAAPAGRTGGRARTRGTGPDGSEPPAAGRDRGGDVRSRLVVGIGLVVVLIIAYAVGAKALMVFSTVIVVAAAAEAYNMMRAPGFRPATLLGLVATAACVLGAYWKGVGAITVVTVLLFIGTMLWYMLGVVEARPLANAAVTVMVFVWVAVLGSFSSVLLMQRHGRGEFLGAILVAVAADVCAFGVGRWIGSRPMAARISPNKTLEGFVGGVVGSLIVGAVVGKELAPWGGMKHGLLLGLVIGLIAPAGDLFESMIKRDLGLKDSGRVLGGHGGILDRFDGILLALPAAYFVATIVRI
jgi:CDP-diglyceride synthetase